MGDRDTLEDDDKDAADAKAEGDKFHEPDGPVMPAFICCVTVEKEKRKLDEHIAGEIEAEDGNIQLKFASVSASFIGDGSTENSHPP